MMNTNKSYEVSFQQILKRFLQRFLPSAAISISLAVFLYNADANTSRDKIRLSEKVSVQQGMQNLKHMVHMITNDVAYIAEQSKNIDFTADDHELYPALDWLIFSRIKKNYDQIRWLDLNGKERIRINFNNGVPVHVTDDNLQNKGNRYYFTDAIKLLQGEFFVSPLDLNVEQGKIQKPIKPMIRIALPLYDHQGVKQGIILLNYLGSYLLDNFSQIMGVAKNRSSLINQNGYWLKGPTPDLEWGFMYKRTENSLNYQHPNSWSIISNNNKGQFENEEGLWSFNTVYPLVEGHRYNSSIIEPTSTDHSKHQHLDYFWKVVLLLPQKDYAAQFNKSVSAITVSVMILLILLYFLNWRLAKSWAHQMNAKHKIRMLNKDLEKTVAKRTKQLQKARKAAEALARTDPLTKMNNRRAFFEYGEILFEQSLRYRHSLSMIMLDIDHFKNINDTYGHPVGDKALKSIKSAIETITRSSDISARIGGEEFAIILPETSMKEAELLSQRLRSVIENNIIHELSNTLTFTASFGVTEILNSDNQIEDLLNRADQALYQAKEQGRNRVVVII